MLKKICMTGLALVVLAGLLSGCGAGSDKTTADTPLRIGSLSMMTMLPLFVAQQEGLFAAEGIDVEIIPFTAVLDRDTAFHGQQLDCIVDDIFSGILLNKDTLTIKVVAVSPVESSMFSIIAAKQSNINTAADLANVGVGVSLNTVVDYATEKLLEAGGVVQSDIKKISIPSMPLRLEMLNQGKIQAGTFSRPLSDSAVLNGNKIICDDSKQSLLTSSIMFSASFLKTRPDDVKKFLKAWSQATQKISANPQSYNDLLIKVANIPSDAAAKITVPKFDMLRNPTQDEFQSKADWMLDKGLLTRKMAYGDVVATGYLPE